MVLDFTTFTHANFTTKGEIPNGTILGKITASGKYGPYDPAATDGRQAAAAVAFNDNTIPANTAAVVTDAALVLVVYGDPIPAPVRAMALHVVPIGWVSERRAPKRFPPMDLAWSWADAVEVAGGRCGGTG